MASWSFIPAIPVQLELIQNKAPHGDFVQFNVPFVNMPRAKFRPEKCKCNVVIQDATHFFICIFIICSPTSRLRDQILGRKCLHKRNRDEGGRWSVHLPRIGSKGTFILSPVGYWGRCSYLLWVYLEEAFAVMANTDCSIELPPKR